MRIRLSNFRCYEDREYTIPDNGMVLLQGPCGSGKSTILCGIVYALYGVAKKPYRHGGKKTCRVELDYRSLEIIRTSRPNRLLVTHEGNRYEDDAAQGVIISVMSDMNYDEFMASSYIIQRNCSSVLSMTPAEQVKFIEKLANTDSDRYKSDIRARIKQLSLLRAKKQGQLELTSSNLEEEQASVTEVECPDGYENFETDAARYRITEELEPRIRDLTSKINQLQKFTEAENAVRDLTESVTRVSSELSLLTEQRSSISQPESLEKLSEIEEEIRLLNIDLKNTQAYEALVKEKHNLQSAIDSHNRECEVKQEHLSTQLLSDEEFEALEKQFEHAQSLWKTYETKKARCEHAKSLKEKAKLALADIFRDIKSWPNGTEDVKSIKTVSAMTTYLEKFLGTVESDIVDAEIAVSEGITYECPSCSATLSFTGNSLVPSTSHSITQESESSSIMRLDTLRSVQIMVTETLAKIRRYGSEMSQDIPSLGKPPTDPLKIQKELMNAASIREQYAECSVLPKSLEVLEKSIVNREAQILSLFEGRDVCSSNEIQDQISTLEEQLAEMWKARSDYDSLSKDIASKQSRLDSLKKNLKTATKKLPKTQSSVSSDIESYRREIESLNDEVSALRLGIDNVSEYEKYRENQTRIEKIEENVAILKSELETLEFELSGFLGLEEACKEAEIIAIDKTLGNINEHARVYLESLFTDPISVRVETVREKGSTIKLQLNTVIDYGGSIYESVDELSGGERQRCDLAFLLAVSDILASPILMLDECLNNLDSTINGDVLKYLHDVIDGTKLILIVSHEAITGHFDDEVHVSFEADSQ